MNVYELWSLFIRKQRRVVRQAYLESRQAGDYELEALIAMKKVRKGMQK